MVTKELLELIRDYYKKPYDEDKFVNLVVNYHCPHILADLSVRQWRKMSITHFHSIARLYRSYIIENHKQLLPMQQLVMALFEPTDRERAEAISKIKGILPEDLFIVNQLWGRAMVPFVIKSMPRKINASDIRIIARISTDIYSNICDMPNCPASVYNKTLREMIDNEPFVDLDILRACLLDITEEDVNKILNKPNLDRYLRLDFLSKDIPAKSMIDLILKTDVGGYVCARQNKHAYVYSMLRYAKSYGYLTQHEADSNRCADTEDKAMVQELVSALSLAAESEPSVRQEIVRQWAEKLKTRLVE